MIALSVIAIARTGLRNKASVFFVAIALSGCASQPAVSPTGSIESLEPELSTASRGRVIARSARFVIYVPTADDTLRSLAKNFLGSEELDWMISEFNAISRVDSGAVVIIPLIPVNPLGVYPNGYQTVPILTYHRFGDKADKMVVTPTAFDEQLAYLAKNDYHVVRLSDLLEFMAGTRPLPKRSVVITMDDGYLSNYQYAYPLLKKYGFPATIFLYSDFAGAPDAMNWTQMKEMVDSKLVDIQAHSKSHANLSERFPGETDFEYRKRVDSEVITPRNILRRKLNSQPLSFAYPYGATSDTAIESIVNAGYRLAVTVNPGGNPFFAHPFLLQRSMVMGDHSLEDFKARLDIFEDIRH